MIRDFWQRITVVLRDISRYLGSPRRFFLFSAHASVCRDVSRGVFYAHAGFPGSFDRNKIGNLLYVDTRVSM